MASITRKDQLPPQARVIAEKIEQHGETWTYELEMPVEEIGDGIQVRDERHDAPPDERVAYTNALRNGAQFPPIVLTRDKRTVDGNTRKYAYKENAVSTVACFVLGSSWAGPNTDEQEHRRARLRLLGAKLNITNGKRLSRTELARNIKVALLDGHTVEHIVHTMNVDKSYVNNINKEVIAERRAQERGLTLGTLNGVQKRALGQAVPQFLDRPEVWDELARLAVAANLSAAEIGALVGDLRSHSEENEQRLILEQEKESKATRIHEKERGKDISKATDPAEVKRQCGWIVKHAEEAEQRTERNPMRQTAHLEFLRLLERAAQAYREAQEALMEVMTDEPVLQLSAM